MRFNLSEWAINHRALVLFMIILLGGAGAYSYLNLGRAEDPSFTIKTMIVAASWPGATASEMQTQVTDRIEKKLQELPYLDRVESYSQPGMAFIQVFLLDRTPPAKVKELWYQVRKKVGDIRGDLPAGVIGPSFNDEYGDVYSALYMLTADGMSLADLKTRAEDIRQQLLRVPNVNKVDIIGERPQKIFIELDHAKLATLGITPQQIFDSVARAERRHLGRLGRHRGGPHQPARHRGVHRRRGDRRGSGRGGRSHLPARRHRDGDPRL